MSGIFWDTNLFIYLFEDRGTLGERATRSAERMEERGDELFASALTLGEILAHPMATGDANQLDRIEATVRTRSVVVPFDEQAARHYAAIRRDKSIKAPDAIQLACAAKVRADVFVTNDDRLTIKNVSGIQFILSLDRALFI